VSFLLEQARFGEGSKSPFFWFATPPREAQARLRSGSQLLLIQFSSSATGRYRRQQQRSTGSMSGLPSRETEFTACPGMVLPQADKQGHQSETGGVPEDIACCLVRTATVSKRVVWSDRGAVQRWLAHLCPTATRSVCKRVYRSWCARHPFAAKVPSAKRGRVRYTGIRRCRCAGERS